MWLYQGEQFTSDQIGNHLGFVYQITNLQTNKKYIGKKGFWLKKKIKRKKILVESDWKIYYGSNKILQAEATQLGSEFFRREMLRLCNSKGEMNYIELKEQILRDVLLKPQEYYNEFIGGKIHRKHLSSLI